MEAVVLAPPLFREATVADVPRLVAMWTQFVATSQYEKYVGRDPIYCTSAMEKVIGSELGTVLVCEKDDQIVGMLGLLIFQQPFSGEIMASELFWWLDPEHRGNGGWLLKRGERWARDRGAQRISMMAPIDKPRVAETYAALGYSEVERIWQKDLV